MEQLFGPLSAGLLLGLIVALVQFAKQIYPSLNGVRADLLSLVLNYILLGGYYVLSTVKPNMGKMAIAWMVFGFIVYPLFGWLAAAGAYAKIAKPFQQ